MSVDSVQNLGSVPASPPAASGGGMARPFAAVSNSWPGSPVHRRDFVHLCLSPPPRPHRAASAFFYRIWRHPQRMVSAQAYTASYQSASARKGLPGEFSKCSSPRPGAPEVSGGSQQCQWDLRSGCSPGHARPGTAPACGHPADGAAGMPGLRGRPFWLGIPGVCLQKRALL